MPAKQKLFAPRSRGQFFLNFFLGVLILCGPSVCRADSLEDAARALARKVASLLNSHDEVSVSIRNFSSLSSEQLSHLSQAFDGELQSRGHKISHSDSAPVILRVTLSENLTGIFEVAELVENGQSTFSLERVELARTPSGGSTSRKFTLVKELVWKQENPILDLKFLTATGEKPERLVVLTPNALSLHENKEMGWALLKTFPVPRSGLQSRDPRGQLFGEGRSGTSYLVADLHRLTCQINLGAALGSTNMECTSNEKEELVGLSLLTAGPIVVDNAAKWNSSGNFFTGELYGESGFRLKIALFYSAAFLGLNPEKSSMFLITAGIDGRARLLDNAEKELQSFTAWGTELTTVFSDCGDNWHILATGRTDWTESDKITVYQLEEHSVIEVDQPVELPGPILSLGSEQIPSIGDFKGRRQGAIAIVRNLKTGDYEAYRISMACSH